jgi:hypothetical protein
MGSLARSNLLSLTVWPEMNAAKQQNSSHVRILIKILRRLDCIFKLELPSVYTEALRHLSTNIFYAVLNMPTDTNKIRNSFADVIVKMYHV